MGGNDNLEAGMSGKNILRWSGYSERMKSELVKIKNKNKRMNET